MGRHDSLAWRIVIGSLESPSVTGRANFPADAPAWRLAR